MVATTKQQLAPADKKIKLVTRKVTPMREIWHAMAYEHRRRSILGFSLMVSQAFKELAKNAGKIGHLNISPDLLETLLKKES